MGPEAQARIFFQKPPTTLPPRGDQTCSRTQITRFGAASNGHPGNQIPVQIGGSARGYQAIFVPSAALGSLGWDGQSAVYLYIAALEVNVLNCRIPRVRVGQPG